MLPSKEHETPYEGKPFGGHGAQVVNLQTELGQLSVEMAEDGSSVRKAHQPTAAKPAECLKVRLRR